MTFFVDVPPGFTIIPGGGFNEDGETDAVNLQVEGSITYTLTLVGSASATWIASEVVFDLIEGSCVYSEPAVTLITVFPDLLTVTKTASGTHFVTGDYVTYDVEVCNEASVWGPAVTGVVVTDELPMVFDAQSLISSHFTADGHLLQANVPYLGPSQCTTLTYTAQLGDDLDIICDLGLVSNCATATSSQLCTGATGCVDIYVSNGDRLLVNESVSTSMGTGTFTGEVWDVHGTFHVDENLTLSGCELVMRPNAAIVVYPEVTLTLKDNTHLHACDEMWQTIMVMDGATIVTETKPIIEDALVGVLLVPGATYDIDDAFFNKNRIHIHLTPYFGSGTTTGSVTSSQFLCHTSALSPTTEGVLLPPYAGHRTMIGIANEQHDGITVGGALNGNLFANANFGIHNTDMSLTSINNEFRDMAHDPTIAGYSGTGIVSFGGADLIVNSNNTFKDSRYGILGYRQTGDVRVLNSHFENLFAGVSLTHIFGGPAPEKSIHVDYNTMEPPLTTGVLCLANPGADMQVIGNEIELSAYQPNDQSTGIAIIEGQQSVETTAHALNNIVENASRGIWAANLTFSGENPWHVRHNTVTMEQTPSSVTSIGILVSNSSWSEIYGNHISGGGTYYDYHRHGIRYGSGIQNQLVCNTTSEMGDGIFIDGPCTPSVIMKNVMEDNLRGLVLNHGTLHDIGEANGPKSHDNTWVGTHTYHTHAYQCDASGYTIFYRPTDPEGIYEPTVNFSSGDDAGPDVFFNKAPAAEGNHVSVGCPSGVGSELSLDPEVIRDILKKALADTSTANPFVEEARWAGRLNVYEALIGIDSLLHGDSLLTAFHDSCQTANIGKLVQARGVAAFPMVEESGIKRPLSAYTLQEYLDSLGAMSTSIVPEAALRDVLVIAFEKHLDTTEVVDSVSLALRGTLLQQLFPDSTFATPMHKAGYTSSQLSVLEAIAGECPYEYGPAVHMARAMLSQPTLMPYMGMHTCESAPPPPSGKWGEEEETVEPAGRIHQTVLVYPNPTNGDIHVDLILKDGEVAVLELFNIMGAMIHHEPLTSGKNTVGTVGIGQGIYHLSVRVNDEMRHGAKQVILR